MSVIETLSQLQDSGPDPLDPPASQETINRVFEYAWHRFNAFDERSVALKRRYRRIREAIILLTWLTTFLAVLTALQNFTRVAYLLVFGIPVMLAGYILLTTPFDKLRTGDIREWLGALLRNVIEHRGHLFLMLLVLGGILGIVLLLDATLPMGTDLTGPRREVFKIMLVILPLLSTGLLTFASRFEAGIAWVGFRLVAESIRREVYRLRVKASQNRLTRSDLEGLRIHVLNQRARLDDLGITIPLWGERYEPGDTLIKPAYTDVPDDDGYTPMTVDQYVNWRVVHQANWYRSRIKQDYHATRVYRAWILFIGALGAFLAAVDYGEFVAVTVAGVTALQAWLGLREHEYSYNIHVRTLLQLQDRIASYYINLRPICEQATRTDADMQAIMSYVKSVEDVLEEERLMWQQSVLQGQEATEASIAQLVTATATDWQPDQVSESRDGDDTVIEARASQTRVSQTRVVESRVTEASVRRTTLPGDDDAADDADVIEVAEDADGVFTPTGRAIIGEAEAVLDAAVDEVVDESEGVG
ncbi:MAG: SLATT domain-containing protein [Anaerolineae bacterium]|nr:SLATT domain-containing protein [Anaerolineae bacterium]